MLDGRGGRERVARFPVHPADVTAPWLSDVLGAQVHRCRLEQIGIGVGLLGRLYRVHLDLRLDQLFFAVDTDDAPVTALDWQLCARGRGASAAMAIEDHDGFSLRPD